jgi:probable rRNA maturation factor
VQIIDIEIAREDSKWLEYSAINEAYFVEPILRVLKEHDNFSSLTKVELSILLTNSERMSSLNNQFMGKNYPADVLSFPEEDLHWRELSEFHPDKEICLGEIAFGFNEIQQSAKERNINFLHHFMHLTIHSILHLVGYDHQDEQDSDAMEALEVKILEQFGINNPYL